MNATRSSTTASKHGSSIPILSVIYNNTPTGMMRRGMRYTDEAVDMMNSVKDGMNTGQKEKFSRAYGEWVHLPITQHS
jgi:hypothetical protein